MQDCGKVPISVVRSIMERTNILYDSLKCPFAEVAKEVTRLPFIAIIIEGVVAATPGTRSFRELPLRGEVFKHP